MTAYMCVYVYVYACRVRKSKNGLFFDSDLLNVVVQVKSVKQLTMK